MRPDAEANLRTPRWLRWTRAVVRLATGALVGIVAGWSLGAVLPLTGAGPGAVVWLRLGVSALVVACSWLCGARAWTIGFGVVSAASLAVNV